MCNNNERMKPTAHATFVYARIGSHGLLLIVVFSMAFVQRFEKIRSAWELFSIIIGMFEAQVASTDLGLEPFC
ncbi:hypothetical protein LY78DRAFT_385140 [Colletotrichum sublineola]|nr:hypothetical protein LY78DRAFT_385140 [Colletotrichum sublineola]